MSLAVQPLDLALSSVESEHTLLGAAMLGEDACQEIFERVRPEHFGDPVHARVWATIVKLARQGVLADPITVQREMQNDPGLTEYGGRRFLMDLADQATTWALPAHTDAVLDASARRDVHALCKHIGALAANASDEPADAILAELERGAADIARNGSSKPLAVPAGLSALDMIEAAWRGDYTGVPVGIGAVDHVTAGIRQDDVWFVGGRTSMGKAQPVDAKVLMADGRWTTMGALRYGDKLASVDGAPSRVVAIHPQGVKPVYRVTFSDGRSTEACAEHLWTVRSPHWPASRTLNTLEVAAALRTVRHSKRLSVPLISGVFGSEDNLPVEPYVLGALIGDGGIKYSTQFTSADPEIVSQVEARLAPDMQMKAVASASYGYSLSARERVARADGSRAVSSLTAALTALGLKGLGSEHKFIPPAYLTASRAVRLDLLRGLMDTDGWAEKHGSVRFSTCSPQLATDVVTLVRSLGGLCSIKEKAATFTYKGERHAGRTQYMCRIRHNDAAELFLLSRKRERAARVRHPARLTITSVEFSREIEAQCITVTHPTQLYVTDDYVVTHNSVLGLNLARGIAEQGRGVMTFSLEMPLREVQSRLIADIAYDGERRYDHGGFENVRYGDLLKGRGSADQRDRARQAARKLAALPLAVTDVGGLTIEDIRTQAQRQLRAWEKAGVERGAVIIDHIGLVKPHGRRNGDSKAAETADVVNELKAIAKQLRAPVIALCQVNRNTENRNDKRPTLADLNWSGAIEQIADFICLLYREAYYLERSADADDQARAVAVEHEMELLIHKNRSGPICNLKVFADVACNVVRDLPGERR